MGMKGKRLLVTGGSGFIGSHFIRSVLATREPASILNLDLLTYAGAEENTFDFREDPRYEFVRGDIADPDRVEDVFRRGLDWVVNFAAESHVDRSLQASSAFISTNVQGVQVLLEAAGRHSIARFLQVSTDEVYGSLGSDGRFTEASPLRPSSPYSASKAAGDLLVMAFGRSFGQDVVITRSSNNYGPCQHPEKFIPLFASRAIEEKAMPLYGNGRNVRDWLFVRDNVEGIALALERGRSGEVYNLGGDCERANIDVAREICRILGKPESLIQKVKDRPGHDWRYALDGAKAREELGFRPKHDFAAALRETAEWYRANPEWLEAIRAKENASER